VDTCPNDTGIDQRTNKSGEMLPWDGEGDLPIMETMYLKRAPGTEFVCSI
jgi:hypothetical protein